MWTLSLLCHDYYPYRAASMRSAETLRAYTLSSTPGVSEYITLTVRRIDEGTGSQWLTQTRRLPLAVRCDGRVYLRR
jgi:NADH oxidoreductase Hcr